MRWLVAIVMTGLLGCKSAPADREQLARAMVEALETGDPEPMASRLTEATGRDGSTLTGTVLAANTVERADLVVAADVARALVGPFRRVGFVWTVSDYVLVTCEHATGDFVYMLGFDAKDQLSHITYATPDRLPASYGHDCGHYTSSQLRDGSIFTGPTADARPRVLIIGTFGQQHDVDLADALACRGIASLRHVPADRDRIAEISEAALVVAHASDRPAVPATADALILDELLPKLPRDSGPHVIANAHVAESVIDQVVKRVKR